MTHDAPGVAIEPFPVAAIPAAIDVAWADIDCDCRLKMTVVLLGQAFARAENVEYDRTDQPFWRGQGVVVVEMNTVAFDSAASGIDLRFGGVDYRRLWFLGGKESQRDVQCVGKFTGFRDAQTGRIFQQCLNGGWLQSGAFGCQRGCYLARIEPVQQFIAINDYRVHSSLLFAGRFCVT